jgi:hypothetical protein
MHFFARGVSFALFRDNQVLLTTWAAGIREWRKENAWEGGGLKGRKKQIRK